MAELPARTPPTPLGTSAAVIRTAGGASTWEILRGLTLTNVTDSPVDVSVGFDSASGAIADTIAKRFIHKASVQPGSPWTFEGFLCVLIGHASTPDRIYAFIHQAGPTDLANAVNIMLALDTGP